MAADGTNFTLSGKYTTTDDIHSSKTKLNDTKLSNIENLETKSNQNGGFTPDDEVIVVKTKDLGSASVNDRIDVAKIQNGGQPPTDGKNGKSKKESAGKVDKDLVKIECNLKRNMSLTEQQSSVNAITPSKEKEMMMLFNESSTTKERFSPLLRQSFAAGGSIIATLSAGMTSGYSAILLPQLGQPESPIELTQETSSWIASIAALPMFIGCIISGIMMEPCGRRLTHLILAAPFVIGWVLIATTAGLPQLLAGRFLTGLCVGLLGPVGSVYIGEISDPKYRGFLLAGIALAISVGLLAVHALGSYCTWRLTAAISSLVPLVSYVMMTFAPESPSWLASKGQTAAAIKSFRSLRGYSVEATEELRALLDKQEAARQIVLARVPVPLFSKQKVANLVATFKRPEFYKPLLIMITFYLTLQFSGINAIAFYSVTIMKSTLGEGIDEYAATLIVDGVRLGVSLAACIILRVVGRRPLALASGIFSIISLFGLAAYKYIVARYGYTGSANSWMPLIFLLGYIISTTVGLNPLPWVMTGEVFPADLRGLGSGICTSACFIAFFMVVKMAPAMFAGLGVEGTFLTYGVVVLLGTCSIYCFLPETKGKTLQDIEEAFLKGTSSKKEKKIDGSSAEQA